MVTTRRKAPVGLGVLLLAGWTGLFALGPPELINFQGVLRNTAGDPENGVFDMVFTFYDADGGPTCTGGNVLLTDSHLAGGTGAVSVTGGLFSVMLGGGSVTPGTANGLTQMARSSQAVYVEIAVNGEVLCPRPRIVSAAYALDSDEPADPPCHGGDGTFDRFVDCGNGTVTDTATGLVWLQNPGCFLSKETWWSANATAEALGDGQCGLTDGSSAGDWRLATRDEWQVIIDQAISNGCSFPYLPDTQGEGCCSTNPCVFIGFEVDDYWTSSTNAANPNGAWGANVDEGLNSSGNKSIPLWVWPVRDGR